MQKRPSKGLTFFLSIVPGVGHLYLRAMTRGLQFMILFFGSFFILDMLALRMFPFAIPIIWFYSFFDALQLADQEIIEDKPLLELKGAKNNMHWVGYALIVFGALILFDNFLPQVWTTFFSRFSWLSVRSFIMAMFFIVAGTIMLRGKKVQADE